MGVNMKKTFPAEGNSDVSHVDEVQVQNDEQNSNSEESEGDAYRTLKHGACQTGFLII